MRLSKEDYRRAEGCLRRYNYNCITIMNIKADIMSVGAAGGDGLPRAPYSISDTVYNQVVRLQEDKELQKCLKEYKIVVQSLELVNKDCKDIFEFYYRKNKTRWETINEMGFSERDFYRKKTHLINTVYKEIKKSWQ